MFNRFYCPTYLFIGALLATGVLPRDFSATLEGTKTPVAQAIVKAIDPMFEYVSPQAWQADNLDPHLLSSFETEDGTISLVAGSKTSPAASVAELIFIDRGVEGLNELLNDLESQRVAGRDLAVVMLEPGRDGVVQISETLARYSDVQSVHIVSHGSEGLVRLGNTTLSGASLSGYAGELAGWSDGLGSEADILFYGCNLGGSDAGKLLTESISELTGADVASSDNITGSALLGGDWNLEFQVGVIDSSIAFSAQVQSDWQYTLDVNIDQAWLDARGAGPYYLDQANETYILQTDVTTDGTAFAIIAKDITFDLNGHTITYDNAAPITIPNHSFEVGTGAVADGWDFSNAPNAERYEGVWLHNEVYDGEQSLRFDLTAGDQEVVSNSTITLKANTTYSLSGMFEYGGQGQDANPGVEGYIRLIGSGFPTREVVWATTNWRGIQFREGVFTTGQTEETYSIHVGINSNANTPSDFFFIDDLRIQQTKVFGVFSGPTNWASSTWTDINRFGASENAIVTNGFIKQGNDNATWAHAVMAHDSNNIQILGLDITLQGANSSALFGFQQGPYSATISDNVLTSNVETITSRDSGHGIVVQGFKGTISNNSIENGPLSGIWTLETGPSQVFGNTVRLQARYTNAYAIIGSSGSDIYNNTIEVGSGDFTARGLRAAGTSTDTALVYGNSIKVQILLNNQEYEGQPLGGAYGMQLEGVGNIEVYDNQVYAYANGVEAHAFRANSLTGDVHVYNNEFHAISDGSALASVMKLYDIQESDILFEDNQLFTNYAIIGGTVDSYFTSIRSTLTVNPLAVVDPIIFESGYFNGSGLNAQIDFVDSTFNSSFAHTFFRNAVPRAPLKFGGAAESRMEFSSQWTTNFHVKDLSGTAIPNATVTIVDKDDNEVFTGTSDENGGVEIVLDEFRTQGDVKSEFGPYTVTVTAQGEESVLEFAADKKQTIDVELNINPPGSEDYTLTYSGTKLYVDGTDGDNDFTWTANSPLDFSVDGFDFNVQAGTTAIHFRGGNGTDSAQFTGSAGADHLVHNDGKAVFTTPAMQVVTDAIENTNVAAGLGADSAFLRGSAGADLFELSASFADVTTDNWALETTGFDNATAYKTDGTDTAVLFDSAGDDQFVSHDSYSIMYAGTSILRANSFDVVVGRSELGGWDVATVYDSVGDDALTTSTLMAQLDGGGKVREAWGFTRTNVRSTVGGVDTAYLVGGVDRETLVGDMNSLTLRGPGFTYQATSFEQVSVDGNAGDNGLYLTDSAGDDFFQLWDGNFYWDESNRSASAWGFDSQVITSANGGYDTVHFLDSAGDDRFTSYETSSVMLVGDSLLKVGAFEHIVAYADAGGNDVAVFHGSSSDETVQLNPTNVAFEGTTSLREADGFGTTSTYLNTGGTNVANFYGSTGDDTLVGDVNGLRLYGPGYSNYVYGFSSAMVVGKAGYDSFFVNDTSFDEQAELRTAYASISNIHRSSEMFGFEKQIFYSQNGGSDSVSFFDSVLNDSMFSNSAYALMSNTESMHRANGFANVSSFANSGGVDTLEIHGTSSVDQITLNENHGRYDGGGLNRYFAGFESADIYLDLAFDQFEEQDVWFDFELIDEVV